MIMFKAKLNNPNRLGRSLLRNWQKSQSPGTYYRSPGTCPGFFMPNTAFTQPNGSGRIYLIQHHLVIVSIMEAM